MTQSEIERRIWMVVGGKFTPDSIGPTEYDRVVAAIRADPSGHLRAFRSAFMTGRPNADYLTDLHLSNLLKILAPVAPAEVRQVAQAIGQRLSGLARAQEREAELSESVERIDELARRQRRIQVHQHNLLQLAQ
jgi:hypothetical protein